MRQNNFTFLLIGLLILLSAAPIAVQHLSAMSYLIIQFSSSATMIVGVWSFVKSRKWFWVGILLVLGDLICTTLALGLGIEILKFVDVGILILFYLLSIVIATRQILRPGRVDFNRIVGAICVYLLLGMIWALVYTLLDHSVPGSFVGLSEPTLELKLWEFMYASFVTLTTLGYGDISPVTPVARSLAYLQAIVGQFFIAILVAALVGMHIAEQQNGQAEKPSTKEP